MICDLQVMVDERSGAPYAEVPGDCMWDLIEYLSFQRAAVEYEFHPSHFRVTFRKQHAASAQELLDHWAHADWSRNQPAAEHARGQRWE